MSIRSERIKALIEQSQKSYQELERITGIKKSSLQRYASGVTTKIPLDVIEKLSITFNVSQEYLMGWDDEVKKIPAEENLSDGEKVLLELFRQVPEEDQRMLLDMIKVALGNRK
jgi:transcriptional regulator with XRE-family HTH domain